MATHETRAGGLIAAGGALFGACLAFSGLKEQIGMARANELEARRLERERRIQTAGSDLDYMRKACGFVESVVVLFPSLDDSSKVPKGAFSERLLDLRRCGELQVSLNAAAAPDGNGESVCTVVGRLSTLAENLYQEIKILPAEIAGGIRKRRDPDVIEQVKELRNLAEILRGKIPRYEQKNARRLNVSIPGY